MENQVNNNNNINKNKNIEPKNKGYAIVGTERGFENKIYYETFGNGPKKVLFITGFLSPLKGWCKQIDYFSKLDEYEICVFDNRGIGNSKNVNDKNSYNLSTTCMAKDAIDLLENTLKWENVNIVGLSMGGMASIHLSSMIPEKVQSLAVACIPNGHFIPMFSKGVFNYLKAMFFTSDPKAKSRIFSNLLFSDEYLDASTSGSKLTRFESMYEKDATCFKEDGPTTKTILGHQVGYILNRFPNKSMDIIRQHNIPTIIIEGSQDNLNTRELTKKQLVDKLNPVNHYVVESGHIITMEKPKLFNLLVENHIESYSKESIKQRQPSIIQQQQQQQLIPLQSSFFNFSIFKSMLNSKPLKSMVFKLLK